MMYLHTSLLNYWVAGQELFEYVQNQQLDENEVRHLFKGILEGVSHLDTLNIIHHDLKLENLKLTSTNPEKATVKILDFGSASKCDQDILLEYSAYSLEYAAPEVLSNEKRTKQSDLWSLGVILYTLLCGHTPFKQGINNSDQEIKRRINNGFINTETERWKTLSENVKDLIKRLLTIPLQTQITLPQVFKHVWITGSVARIRNYCDFLLFINFIFVFIS